MASYITSAVIRLPDGRHVDINTPSGASEIQVWLNDLIEELTALTTNTSYIRTGSLGEDVRRSLFVCGAMFDHPVPALMAFQSEFFSAVANLIKARKGNNNALPSEVECGLFTLVVSHAFWTAVLVFEEKWSPEKALKKLESSGVLAQFLRCSTVPQERDDRAVLGLLEELQLCGSFLSSKFRKGKPCGAVLFAILQNKDGSTTERPKVMKFLRNIGKLVDEMDPKLNWNPYLKSCRKCGKTGLSDEVQKSLMQCGRCKHAFYCSRECQKDDWKVHKKTCHPYDRSENKTFEAAKKSSVSVVHKSYLEIALRMAIEGYTTGLESNKMLIELDFMENKDGIVPALQNPPIFGVVPIREYAEGLKEPEWLNREFQDIRENHVEEISKFFSKFRSNLKSESERMSTNHFLLLVHHSGRTFTMSNQIIDPTTHKPITSIEAIKAFQSAIFEDNYDSLSLVFAGPMFQYFKEIIEHKKVTFRPVIQNLSNTLGMMRELERLGFGDQDEDSEG